MGLARRIGQLALALGVLSIASAAHAEDWLTFGKTNQRNGYNGTETILSTRTVPTLHQLWSYKVTGPVLGQPTLASGILVDDRTGTGNKIPLNVVYAADLNGTISALDAGGGGVIWQKQLPSIPTTCEDFPQGHIGIVGTPTIDKPNNRLWAVAGDGTLWALDLSTGQPLNGYPLQIIGADNQNGRTIVWSSPTYLNGSLYVTTAGVCDVAPFHGQLIKVNVGTSATDLPAVVARWYPTGAQGPNGGGVWGWGGVSVEDDGSYIYAATGNAENDPENVGYAEQIVKLDPSLTPVAAYTPQLEGIHGKDVDFGATPLLYQPPGCPPLMAAMNKSGVLFVLRRDNVGIAAGALQRLEITNSVDIGGFIGIPVYDPISNKLYLGNTLASTSYTNGLLAFNVQPDCTLSLAWQQTLGADGTSGLGPNVPVPPVVANGIVYYSAGVASAVYAYNTYGNHLWNSGTQIQGGIFASPTVVNGMLIVGDYHGNVTAFGP